MVHFSLLQFCTASAAASYIIISILSHHYKELKECILEVEQIEARVNNEHRRLMVKEEEKPKALNQARHTTIVVSVQENTEKRLLRERKRNCK
jgi:hypothetical protein